ncbi:RagB/SusD family nutrient uptake outer membrane protein [Solitalea longa]|nr:RagB/SusD family nutrient uptake outer membrane protein [Solitalea longa]
MKKKLLYIPLIPLLLTVNSCTNLDEKLYNTIPTDEYGKTPQEIETIVGRAYASLRGYAGHFPLDYTYELNENASDEAVIPTRGTDWYDGGVHQRVQRHNWKPDENLIQVTWEMLYSGITIVNSIIFQVDQSSLTADQKANVKAELRGVRAYYYYRLCDMFGNVPLQIDYNDKEVKAKSTRAEVFNFIESELKDIVGKLPTSGYGKFTKAAGYSLLARLYINAEVFKGTPMWQECIDACDQVTGYSLQTNFLDNFLTENQGSVENIFVVPYDATVTLGNFKQSLALHYQSRVAFQTTADFVNGYCCEPGVYGKFEENDARRKGLLQGPLLAPDGSQLLQSDGNPVNYTDAVSLESATQSDGIRDIKYQNSKGDKWERSNDYVLIRYAEVMLMKAEALIRLGRGGQAQPIVAAVRKRANVETPANVDLDFMYDELLREFLFEEHRRTDQIRFGKFSVEGWEMNQTDKRREIYPIPTSAMQTNNKLVQNPGY